MNRTERIYLPWDTKISFNCHLSNNLYNEANYLVRKYFFESRDWIRYTILNWLMKDVRRSKNYYGLPVKTSQQILMLLDRNWKSFFKAIKNWKKNSNKYLGMPNLPYYREKNGENLLIFSNQQIKEKNGYLIFPKKIGLKIKTRITQELRGTRILPLGEGYLLEIIYNRSIKPLSVQKNRITAIDLGLNNLITMVNNIGKKPIVVNGKGIKALNQLYNKRKSKLQS